MKEIIIQKVYSKNFSFKKFLSLTKEEKQFIIKIYQKDFEFSSKLFFYENLKNFVPFQFLCPECNKELSINQVFKQYKSKEVTFCSNRCAQKQKITINKIKNTCLKKYGVKFTSQIPESREKFKNTCLERYGGQLLSNPEIKKKAQITCLERYGKNKWVNVSKRNETRRNNSGIRYDILDNLIYYVPQKVCSFQKFEELLKICNCSSVLLYRKLAKQGIETEGKLFRSKLEQQVIDFIKFKFNFYLELNGIHFGIDLDIFIPDLNLAIEVNGDYWHSINNSNKYKNHHKYKTNICEKNNIRLLHIWEHEWKNNQEQVKEIIKSYLKGKIPDISSYNGKLPRDYFSTLDFSNSKIEESELLELSSGYKIYKSGYLLIGE